MEAASILRVVDLARTSLQLRGPAGKDFFQVSSQISLKRSMQLAADKLKHPLPYYLRFAFWNYQMMHVHGCPPHRFPPCMGRSQGRGRFQILPACDPLSWDRYLTVCRRTFIVKYFTRCLSRGVYFSLSFTAYFPLFLKEWMSRMGSTKSLIGSPRRYCWCVLVSARQWLD